MLIWRSLLVRAIAVLAMLLGGAARSETAFSRLVVFGDSLSDTGNAGRFSNGSVWVEVLARRLNVTLQYSQAGGLNFAVGGARLDPRSGPTSLRAQADLFLKRPRQVGRTLHVVYGGGNDLLAAVGHPQAFALVEAAAASLHAIVADLVEHGATDILVPNLPDIGITPEIRARGPQAIGAARALTVAFNSAADRRLSALMMPRSGPLRIYRLNVYALAERVIRDPTSFGFVESAKPCSGSSRCEGYLFWDRVHPTAQAHRRLAEAALSAVLTQETR
jgi:phospholipase/lecithinase/hemolysin